MKRLIYSFILMLLCLSLINSVYADFTPVDAQIDIEDQNLANSGAAMSNNQVFYNYNNTRFYVFYPYYDSSTEVDAYYSYTDAGSNSSWNAGGSFQNIIRRDNSAVLNNHEGAHIAVVWDPDTNKLHSAVYMQDDTYPEIRYKRHSFAAGGSLTLENQSIIYNHTDDDDVGTVDICLDPNGYPMISAAVKIDGGTSYTWAFIANSSAPNSTAAFTSYYWNPFGNTREQVVNVPLNDTKMIQFAADMDNTVNLRYKVIEYGVTTNSTVDTGTSISDDLLYFTDGVDSNKPHAGWVGASWSDYHGCIAYTNTSYCTKAFIFDFETLTFSDEYTVFEGNTTVRALSNMVSVHNNEFFVGCVYWESGANCSLYLNEYTTATGNFDNPTLWRETNLNVQEWQSGFAFARNASEGGALMCLGRDADNYAISLMATLEGQYGSDESQSDIIWLWLTDRTSLWFGLVGGLMMVLAPLFMVKAFKDGDPQGFAIALLIMTVVGFSLVVGWLYG